MKKTFFASDFHLGAEARLTSAERERQLVRWLDAVAPEAEGAGGHCEGLGATLWEDAVFDWLDRTLPGRAADV